ncbi:hypothetical protein Ancab_010211 [Ancistrocladus abbreviatus]
MKTVGIAQEHGAKIKKGPCRRFSQLKLKMALPLQSSSFITKPHLLLHTPFHSITKPKFTVISKDSSTANDDQTVEPTSNTTPTKKTLSPGQGFGSSSELSAKSTPSPSISKRKQKGKRERASIVRRAPVEKPSFLDKKDEKQGEERSRNESAFLLAWLALGALILVEGIALAASGNDYFSWSRR